MSDASQAKLSFRDELTWGEAVATVASPIKTAREFRFTSEGLTFNHEAERSNEIRSDRNTVGMVRVAASAAGPVNIEASFGSHDPLLEGAFYNNWDTLIDINNPNASPFDNRTVTVTANVTSPIQDSTGTISVAGSPNGLLNAVVGHHIEISGSGSPDVDGFYLVTANTAGSLTVQPSPSVSTSGTMRVRQSGIHNSTVAKSFLIEKELQDVSEFFAFTGQRVESWALNVTPGSILTGVLNFRGKEVFEAGSTVWVTSPLVAPLPVTTDVLNSVDNIGNIQIDGVTPSGVNFTEVSLEINNNLRDQPAIGSLFNVGVGAGTVAVTGTIVSYFLNRNLYTSFRNFSDVKFSFTATDAAGNTYLFFFPKMKITSGEVVAGGNNQDVLANFSFEAILDATLGFAFALNRFPTAASTLLPATASQ